MRETLTVDLFPGLEVLRVEDAVVREHVEDPFVDERCGHVRAAARAAPGDRAARGFSRSQREVAACTRPNREERTLRSASAGDDEQSVSIHRRGRSDLRTSAQPPELLAGLRIVAANELRRVRDE